MTKSQRFADECAKLLEGWLQILSPLACEKATTEAADVPLVCSRPKVRHSFYGSKCVAIDATGS
jgi:hypothetical protein